MVEFSHNFNFPTATELLDKNVRSKLRICSYLNDFHRKFVLILVRNFKYVSEKELDVELLRLKSSLKKWTLSLATQIFLMD